VRRPLQTRAIRILTDSQQQLANGGLGTLLIERRDV